MTARRLLFATSSIFYPDSSGGAEQSLLCLFDGLRRRGWEVELVCGRSLRSPRLWTAAAAALGRLRAPSLFMRDDVRGFPCWRGPSRFRAHPRWAAWFDRRLAEYGPDAVLGYNNLTCPLLRRAARLGYPSFFIVRSLANLFGASRFIPDEVHLLANSPFAASIASQAIGKPVEVVLPLVDFAAYRAEPRERRYVTFINPMPEKGVEVALAVARAMPDVPFLFVKGKWGDRSYGRVGSAGLANVEVWDYRDDMRAVYAVTDVLLVPSQWLETFGRVIVEAQTSAIPVVAADVGGIPFTLGEGGLLVRPKGDPAAYVDALRRLRSDEQLYRQLSARALANSRRPEFDPERQVDVFIGIVERALASRMPEARLPIDGAGHASPGEADLGRDPDGGRGLALAAAVVSVLQGAFFVLTGRAALTRVVGAGLAAVTLTVAWAGLRRCTWLRLGVLAVLLSLGLAAFVVHAHGDVAALSWRSLFLSLAFGYAGLAAATLLRAARIAAFANALLLCFSVSLMLLLADVAMARSQWLTGWKGGEWLGAAQAHPVLGHVHAPHSVALSFYPDDPRGYFDVSDPRENRWHLVTNGGSAAHIEPGDPQIVRVTIDALVRAVPWDVQLTRSRLAVRAGRRYELSFSARASGSRRIDYAVSQAHRPWKPLGLHGQAELDPGWKDFRAEFMASHDDERGRVSFDLGGSDRAVELADVALRRLPEGTPLGFTPDYTVQFRFNALGCRGPDYDIPPAPGVFRIVVLGDSFVLGLGVHERDTVTTRLQALLNARADGSSYEVIGCGVSAYGTREERIFYETFASRYRAPVILLGMVFNDDRSALDEIRAHDRRQQGLGHAFNLWRLAQRWSQGRPDYSGCIQEVKRLDAACRERGARLAVFVFRHSWLVGAWKELVRQVTRGLQGTDIPLVDLGPALLGDHAVRDLRVHPIDGHPNEIAHGLAAAELLRFLERGRLLEAGAYR